jgi:protein phosphatase
MRRAVNQDALAVRICSDFSEWARLGHLFVVADGIGGHAVGDLASRICVDTLPNAFAKHTSDAVEDSIHHAILAANKAINDRARENREFEGMGTTCTALSLSAAGAIAGHVGDSRLYRFRRGLIQQLTFDHSLQWEMVRLGRATPENVELFHPRNVITRCLGPDTFVQVDIEGPFPVEPGDIYMLCSDGVTNHVTDPEIGLIISNLTPLESSRLLINLANFRGGHDNSTAVVVSVESYPSPGASSPGAANNPDQRTPENPGASVTAPRRPALAANAAALVTLVLAISLCIPAARVISNVLPPGPIGFAAAGVAAVLILFLGVVAAIRLRQSFTKPAPSLETLPPTGPNPDIPTIPNPPPITSISSSYNSPPSGTAPESPALPGTSSERSLLRSSFNSFPPYRTSECRNPAELLKILADAQTELTPVARDRNCNVSPEELEQLDRQATAAINADKPDRAFKARARAIDIVMREICQKQRSHT